MITWVIKKNELEPELKRLRVAGGDWKIVLEAFGAYGLGSVAKNFKEQGRPEKWKPIKEATILARYMRGNRKRKRKRSEGSPGAARFIAGAKILIDSGRLSNSIGFRATWNQVEIGTNLVYAATQNLGSKKRKIPARPFLFFQEEDVAMFEKLILDHLAGK